MTGEILQREHWVTNIMDIYSPNQADFCRESFA